MKKNNLRKSEQLKVKDAWCKMIVEMGKDHESYKTAEDLKELIDDLVDLAEKAINCDTTTVATADGISAYNILHEEICTYGEYVRTRDGKIQE